MPIFSSSIIRPTFRNLQGFTLTELMVTVAIIAILASIALPSYKKYVYRGRRSDALQALSLAQVQLERCYAANFSYLTCAAPAANSPNNYYAIALSNQAATTYTLTATAINAQLGDTTCASLSVDQFNQNTAVDSSGNAQAQCWNLK